MFKKFEQNKDFYKSVLVIAVPMMIQNGITNFVSLLDNLMVGQVGTLQMSGVSIANQLLFISNLTIFGGLAGAGIFASQFFGKGDTEGVKSTIRYKLYLAIVIIAVAITVFLKRGPSLISIYLKGGDSRRDIQATLGYGLDYIHVMVVGLVPFALTQVYASTLRECGESMLPMKAGLIAVVVNLVFNYFLIFGNFGFPCLGIKGAAIATVISRFVEFFVVFIIAKRRKAEFPFFVDTFDTFKINGELAKQITLKGTPLLANEFLWSVGIAMLSRCYSFRGLDVVAAMNISQTISNLFNTVFLSLGNALGIIIGHELGAGNVEKAYDDDIKLIWFSTTICVFVGLFIAVASLVIPDFYNTTAEVKALAREFLLVVSVCAPIMGFTNCCYFTLRCGGKTLITFLFDSMFVLVINLPSAYLLTHFTGLPVVRCYALVNFEDLFKSIYGYILVKKKIWVNNMVG